LPALRAIFQKLHYLYVDVNNARVSPDVRVSRYDVTLYDSDDR